VRYLENAAAYHSKTRVYRAMRVTYDTTDPGFAVIGGGRVRELQKQPPPAVATAQVSLACVQSVSVNELMAAHRRAAWRRPQNAPPPAARFRLR